MLIYLATLWCMISLYEAKLRRVYTLWVHTKLSLVELQWWLWEGKDQEWKLSDPTGWRGNQVRQLPSAWSESARGELLIHTPSPESRVTPNKSTSFQCSPLAKGTMATFGRTVHEKMSFGSFSLANRVSETCPRHIAQTSNALRV